MTDDIEQLLKNLHFDRIRHVVERELQKAEKSKPSYANFYAKILREQYDIKRQRSAEYRISPSGPSRAMDARIVPV
jgi:hypothetical protein